MRLTQVAALFAQYQEGWRFYRLGGEVFAALLDKRHVTDRRALAQCCDTLLAEAARRHACLSIGASDSAEASERLVLQTLADNRLYISKHHGKNCATLPPERPPVPTPSGADAWPDQ